MAAWNTRGIQKRNFTSGQLTGNLPVGYWQGGPLGFGGMMEDPTRYTLESGKLPKCGSPSSVFVCK